MLPLNLMLYTKYSYDDDIVEILDWTALFTSLVVVIGAIGLGLFCSAKIHSHRFNVFCNKMGNIAGIALVVFSATMSNTGGGDTRIWNRDLKFYLGVAAPCVAGLIISNIVTTFMQLKRPERVTTSIECCYQNVGIATSVALTMFKGDDLATAMGVPLYYGLVEAAILGLYCVVAWKCNWTKAPRDAPFCHIITMSYEVYRAEVAELETVEVQLADDASKSCDESISDTGDTIFTYFAMDDVLNTKKESSDLVRFEREREESSRSLQA